MIRHAWRVVELPAVMKLLEPWIPSPLGLARLARVGPSRSARVVRERIARTREAMNLLATGERLPLGPVEDPLPTLRRASAGGVLSGEELASVGGFISECVRVGTFLRDHARSCPRLASLVNPVGAEDWDRIEATEAAILASIDPSGAVRDDASGRMRAIRAALRGIDARIREAAHGALRHHGAGDVLQEMAVHYRGGRPVLPVRAEARDRVPGVVRDVSASGATVFVEPVEAARLGRQKERLLKEQDREERRIRRSLSQRIAALSPTLTRLRTVVGRVEVVLAAASFGHTRGGICPELCEDGTIDLREVRHPLLPPDSVPLSLRLDASTRTVLITGPNTGGKTVALKTIGLAVLMTACGIPILGREGTRVPCLCTVYADIGDEQSIEQSLSTFSGHMSHIVRVVCELPYASRRPCLVLLDELGAGTDPAEGEALGCAILEWLHAKGGPLVRVVATSHFARLKELAASTEGMANARMEFDPRTLRPTFVLSMGASGASQAFPVAHRLGLPDEIMERARCFLGPERVELQRLLGLAEEERHRLHEERQAVIREREALERERVAAADEAKAQMAALAKAREEFEREAQAVLEWSRRKLKEARLAEGVAAAQRRHVELHRELRWLSSPTSTPQVALPSSSFSTGDVVGVPGCGRGVVEHVDPKRGVARVSVGGRRVTVPLSSLSPAGCAAPTAPLASPHLPEVDPTIRVIGLRAEEALQRVVRHVDDASAADLPWVRIIHGLGTGVLMRVVREALRSHPAVARFEPGSPQEGGPGVTIAYLQRVPDND